MNISYLGLRNYLSYKKVDINFDNEKSMYLVIGRNSTEVDESEGNGAGKTAFASAPAFALYGRCRGSFDKELLKEDIIYINEDGVREKKCEVHLEFDHNGAGYRAIRSVTDKGAQKLSLYVKEDDGSYSDLTLKAGVNKRTNKRENGIVRTQQRIDDLLGCDADLFVNSVYFEQSNIDTFARGSLSEKDGIIKNAAGIYKWSDYALIASKDVKDHEASISQITTLMDDCGDADEIKKSMVEFEKIINELKILQVEEQEKLNVLKLLIESSNTRIAQHSTLVEQKKSLEKELESVIESVNFCSTGIETSIGGQKVNEQQIFRIDSDIVKTKEEIDKLNKELECIKPKDYTVDDATKISKEVQEITNEMSVIKSKIEDNITKGKSIQSMACSFGYECDKLGPNEKAKYRNELLLEYNIFNGKLKELNEKLKEKQSLSQEVCNDLNLKVRYMERKRSIEQLKNNLTTLIGNKDFQEKGIQNFKASIVEMETRKIGFDKRRNELLVDISKIVVGDFEEDKIKLSRCIEKKEIIDKGVDEHKKNIVQYTTYIETQNQKLEKAEKLKVEFIEKSNKLAIIKYALNSIRKDIPHNLIKNVIPELEGYTREFLYKLSNGRMDLEFKLNRELKSKSEGSNITNSFDIWVTVDGKELKYAQTSGGERARADVAIHLAYVCFMSNRSGGKLENIWLDEVGMALDENGVEVFVDIISKLKKDYGFKKIFVITQSTKMKKMFDNIITVVRSGDGSKVYGV